MSSLMRAELLRLVSRRLLIVLLVCVTALAAFGSAVSADGARPLTAQDRRDAQQSFVSDRQYWQEECATGASASQEVCQGWEAPTNFEDYLRTPIGFGLYTEGVVGFGLPIVLLAVAVMAASLVGAEFSSGNVGTQLLFTPRRVPLFISKVVAAAVGGLLVAVAHLGTSLGFSAIMFLSLRGADDMTAGIELPMALGRALVLAVLIAVMAGALAMAVGSTLITAGIFAVTLLGSVMAGDAISGSSLLQVLLPGNILFAMLDGRHEIFDYQAQVYEAEPLLAHVINYDWALGYSVAGTAMILVVSAWWFHRRDILR